MIAFKLSSFCREAGAALIADYAQSVLEHPFPAGEVPEAPKARTRFLTDYIGSLPDDKNRRAEGDFRRVQLLSTPAGQEALRQCLDPGDWRRKICSHQSARQRALFCWMHRREAFLAAEFRKEHKQRRLSLRDAALFDSLPGREATALRVDPSTEDAFSCLIASRLSGRLRRGTGCRFRASAVLSETMGKTQTAFQLGIRWTDGTRGRFQPAADGADFTMTDLSEIITLTYLPAEGRILVTGTRLRQEDFAALAGLFAARVLGTPQTPKAAPRDLIRPEAFIRVRPLSLPARLSAVNVRFRRICLILPTSRQPAAIPLEPSLPVLQSVSRHLGQEFSLRTFPLSDIRSVQLEFCLETDKTSGTTRTFRLDVSSTGLKLSSALDGDLCLAETFLEQNGILVRAGDAPLLARAAG